MAVNELEFAAPRVNISVKLMKENAVAEGSQMWKGEFSTRTTIENTSAAVLIDGWLANLTILRLASMLGAESMSGRGVQ